MGTILRRIYQLLTIASFLVLLYDFGYEQSRKHQDFILQGYLWIILIFSGFELYRVFTSKKGFHPVNLFRLVLPAVTFLIITLTWLTESVTLQGAISRYEILFFLNVLLLLFFELTFYINRLYTKSFSPATIFVGSFMFLIAAGTSLLMLPNSTTNGITLVDAMFTITSAVCVTGLTVLDTAKDFTFFGQNVILIFIQLGGLGILTLTTFFAYFFKGKSSYQEDLYIKDFLNSDQLSGLLELALKIVGITLVTEFIGAMLIFASLPSGHFEHFWDEVYFSIFHSVSAFCNAGFSTLSSNLYEPGFRFNYNMHLVIAFLIIAGGLGFNVFLNLFLYFKYKVLSWYTRYILNQPKYHKTVRLVTLNTKIVLYTTGVLLLVGTVLYFIFEYNHTLQVHTSWWGKLVTSFFGSVTPRTAGFNTVNMRDLATPTVMITIFLMWVGASPASTGGGIKTSTFAVATLNIINTANSKNRIDLGRREIPQLSVNRAFSIICLSLIVAGLSITMISAVEEDMSFLDISFECFSALGTVGLSLGITSSLTDFSKLVLIVTMFLGRVGMINIMIGFLRQIQSLPYRYPQEAVMIN